MENKNIFASNLQKYMDLNRVSRKDLSDSLGVSYYTITSWVNGSKYPRMDKVEMLAEYFGILKSDLIEEKIEDAINDRPEEMAAHHFEMIMDEDLNDIFKDFKDLNEQERQLIKDLVHSMAERKKTEA